MYHRFAVFFEYKNGTESTFQASYYRIRKKISLFGKTALALPYLALPYLALPFGFNVICVFFSKMSSFCSLAMFRDPL